MIALAILLAKCCSKDSYIRNIYTYGLAFSNFGFMGNAVVKVVFPELFLEYLIFVLPLWTMIYLWGVPCLLIPSEGGKQTFKNRMKSFVNPMFISMVIGILIGLSGWKLPTPITTVVNTAGDCMSPIAMLLTGMTVAKMDAKKILSMKSIYAVSLIRLVLFPMIFIGFFHFVPMSTTTVVCTICSLAMPLGLSTLVIPSGYGKDTSVAAGMAIVSHLLSVITIPIVFYIMMKVLL
jgi:predicted permease